MKAAADAVLALEGGSLQDVFNAAAKGLLNAVGASSGPLCATAFLRAGKAAGPKPGMPAGDLGVLVAAMAEGIAQRGKAEPGQKTMIDVWVPAAAALCGAGPTEIAAAARAGAEATRGIVATLGRAARVGERSLGHPDPGAVSAAMIVGEICACFAALGQPAPDGGEAPPMPTKPLV